MSCHFTFGMELGMENLTYKTAKTHPSKGGQVEPLVRQATQNADFTFQW